MDKPISEKHKSVVDKYILQGLKDGGGAYSAFYKVRNPKAARNAFTRMMKRPEVKSYVVSKKAVIDRNQEGRFLSTVEQKLDHLRDLAEVNQGFFDLAKMAISGQSLTEEQKALLATFKGFASAKTSIDVIALMSKLQGQFEDHNRQKTTPIVIEELPYKGEYPKLPEWKEN